ncbi:glutathione transferase GstA [Bordetella holmesii]|uniref:Glutathione S-transferase n=2 Tax=Bordetella holmesii TaxID=35814 RepID=A0A158M910_9BORD|nr:glutathione transferase GstA [Bordetella holmesii]AHV94861.1 glutathione S-transferase [Bordetella holmesii ATCC 51541]AIT26200.1 glutathione S-transferase [Bordetella holmesii 44057]EWM43143.1 glutathione S-transferase [Bordetella holmesii 41130]EWM46772.1 glutathione S-transferase [Bordetella holmesii 35009]EWM50939.1 glutathione S-transferase [Bordetella holmesii 70147]
MKLYYSPGSCSLAPHIALQEAGIDFELAEVSLDAHQLDDGGDYFAINALGYVPVLELPDGTRLHETLAILQFLAEHTASGNIDAVRRAQLAQWLAFIGTELHSVYYILFSPDADEAFQQATRAKLRARYEWVESQLQHHDHLTGASFSVADAYLFAVTNWADAVGVDLKGLPRLQAWLKRVAERPAVQDVLRREEG